MKEVICPKAATCQMRGYCSHAKPHTPSGYCKVPIPGAGICPSCVPTDQPAPDYIPPGGILKPDALPLEDPRYKIEGTNLISFSKWARENTIYPDPQFKVGDEVTFTVDAEVTSVYKDCDGSTLYSLDRVGHGWCEENIKSKEETNANSRTKP